MWVNIGICLLVGILFWVAIKLLQKTGEIVFNFIFSILSFAAVIIPISLTLPLDIQFPELFPGLAVPMVFFPAVAWYTIRPLFILKCKDHLRELLSKTPQKFITKRVRKKAQEFF
jgi:hypothetical protein